MRLMLAGGEQLRRSRPPSLPFPVVNIYGPTETTVVTTSAVVADEVPGSNDLPDIGRPVANLRLHVLDRELRPVPVGAVGELCISGVQVARGYLASAALTAERFVPDAPGGEPGARLYRSGDLVRWRTGGTLAFVGRNDRQVKIRGFRIGLPEVERALALLPRVREAAVDARRDMGYDLSLAAYVVLAGGAPADPAEARGALAGELAKALPAHMLPHTWTFLPSLPLTPNGKLDRSRLPRPDAGLDGGGPGPESDLERTLESLWCAELGLERVPTDRAFFRLGGHSLSATRLLNRVREALGVDYPMLEFFQEPTIRAMAAAIARSTATGVEPAPRPARASGTL
jgi:acyl-CoA synthetase (AMP-forming)/AMP-acid ligase II/acyl carrier protein